MKNVFIFVLLIVMASLCYGVVQIGAGLDFDGTHYAKNNHLSNYSREDLWDITNGFSPSVELMKQRQDCLIGIGLEFQIPRENKPYDFYQPGTGKFGFIPVYTVLRYQYPFKKIVKSELIFNGGYNFIYGDEKFHIDEDFDLYGGLYFGMGIGFELRNVVLQLMYKENRATRKFTIIDDNMKDYITNRQTNLTLGYRF